MKPKKLFRRNTKLKNKAGEVSRQNANKKPSDSNIDKLIKEKAVLETLINTTPEAIVQTTTEGIIERINEQFIKEFGYSREETLGKNIDDLIVPPELRNEGISFTKRTANNEKIVTNTYRISKDGNKIYVTLT
ncbi:MAG TPA: hypothetical protein DEQ09_10120, partial [Bacteroidales bacterium]|nr:hypothetical protein [Bacteroidales bacterium]